MNRRYVRPARSTLCCLALTLASAGCAARQQAGLGVTPTVAPARPVVVPAAGRTVTLSGRVLGPGEDLVRMYAAELRAGGAKLLGRDATGLLTGLGGVGARPVALAGARVRAEDERGRALTTAPAVCDAAGAFRIELAVPPGTRLVALIAEARVAGETLRLAAVLPTADQAPARRLAQADALLIDPAATAIANRVLALASRGALAPDALAPATLSALHAVLAERMAARALVAAALAAPTQFDELVQVMGCQSAELREAWLEAGEGGALLAGEPLDACPAAVAQSTGRNRPAPGAGAPQGGASTELTTEASFALVRVAGDATGGNALGGSPTTAAFGRIAGIVRTDAGRLFVADAANHQIREVPTAGATILAAGQADGVAGFAGDGLAAVFSRLDTPQGLAVDAGSGTLFVCDRGNGRVRAFPPGGRISTFAGGGADAGDTVASPTAAALDQPVGVAIDDAGVMFVSEAGNGRVRRLPPGGGITTIATFGPGTTGALAVDGDDDLLWVADGRSVRVVTQINGVPTVDPDVVYDAGAGRTVTGLATDQRGTLFVLETGTAPAGRIDTRVRRLGVNAAGRLRTGRVAEAVAGTGGTSGAAADFSAPTIAIANALDQLLAGGGICNLFIDLTAAEDPGVLSGQLYVGNDYDDGVTRWGQVLRLDPAD